MNIRTNTAFAILGVSNLAVWLAALVHMQIAFRNQRELVDLISKMEQRQTASLEEISHHVRKIDIRTAPTTRPATTTETENHLQATTDRLNKILVETDRKTDLR